ncbi:hypothetical protein DFJ74DRAFT_670298 [Hyaloraphidium curvatum]|nr:hypothetical protein DFJ74DRAFT_670298 [Hyaloraphidium curvatum]
MAARTAARVFSQASVANIAIVAAAINQSSTSSLVPKVPMALSTVRIDRNPAKWLLRQFIAALVAGQSIPTNAIKAVIPRALVPKVPAGLLDIVCRFMALPGIAIELLVDVEPVRKLITFADSVRPASPCGSDSDVTEAASDIETRDSYDSDASETTAVAREMEVNFERGIPTTLLPLDSVCSIVPVIEVVPRKKKQPVNVPAVKTAKPKPPKIVTKLDAAEEQFDWNEHIRKNAAKVPEESLPWEIKALQVMLYQAFTSPHFLACEQGSKELSYTLAGIPGAHSQWWCAIQAAKDLLHMGAVARTPVETESALVNNVEEFVSASSALFSRWTEICGSVQKLDKFARKRDREVLRSTLAILTEAAGVVTDWLSGLDDYAFFDERQRRKLAMLPPSLAIVTEMCARAKEETEALLHRKGPLAKLKESFKKLCRRG